MHDGIEPCNWISGKNVLKKCDKSLVLYKSVNNSFYSLDFKLIRLPKSNSVGLL